MSKFRTLTIVLSLTLLLAGIVASNALAQEEESTFNISGQITYIDDDGSIKPAAGVHVSIIDWDFDPAPGPREVLGEVITDEEGFYSASGLDNEDLDGSPPRPEAGQDVFIQVRTQSPEIELFDMSTLKPFVWSSKTRVGGFFEDVPDDENLSISLRVRADDPDATGMDVYETMRAGWNFLSQKPTLDAPIVAQWGAGSLEGNYFLPGQRIYYKASAAIYPHVILHHFAHALAWEIQGDAGYPTSCFPSPTDHTFDMRTQSTAECAWVEGWAAGFASIVLGDPNYRTAEGVIDIEAQDADTPGFADGDTVAVRVAGALWDLWDTEDDGFDTHSPAGDTPEARFAPMWDSYVDGNPTTTEAFWASYLAGGHNACSGVRAFFQNTIDYNNAPTVQELPDITIDEDESLEGAIDLWAFSSDVECPNEQLVYTFVDEIPPEFGITIRDNRYIDVDPAPDWFGSIEVGIRVSDGLERTQRFFTLTIGGVNDAPTLGEIPRFEALINTPITVDLTPYVDDVDNLQSDLSVSVQFLENATVSIDGLVLTFTPDTDFEGTETPRVRVEDGAGGSAETDLVLIWSRAPNNRPQIVDLPSLFQQDVGVAIEINFTDYATDQEDPAEDLRWDVEELGEHVSVQRRTDTTLLFSPEPSTYLGSETVTVVVSDQDGGRSEPAEIRLLWTPASNVSPMITKPIREQKAFVGRPLTLNLQGYAIDPDGNDAALIWFPNKATVDCCQVSLNDKQQIIFFPLPGWGTQSDTVELVVRDPLGAEARTNVVLTWELFKTFMPLITNNASGQ